jgi:hypothetical protein
MAIAANPKYFCAARRSVSIVVHPSPHIVEGVAWRDLQPKRWNECQGSCKSAVAAAEIMGGLF